MALKRGFISHKSYTLADGQSKTVNISGSYFRCIESSARFQMSVDNGEKFPMELGLGFLLPAGDTFKRLTFYNETAGASLTFQFYAASALIDDARLNTLLERQIAVGYQALPTRVVPGSATTIGPGVTISVPGVNAGDRRKQIVVSNNDLLNDLHILDSAGDEWSTVFPRTSWTMETNATVKIYNPSGTDTISLHFGELYYDV